MTSPTQTYISLFKLGRHMADWYDVAAADIVTAARTHKTSDGHPVRPETLAGLLAAFSPRTSVVRSVKWTLHFLQTGNFMPDCPRTIQASVVIFMDTGRIRGPKTGPFARALLGDPDAVVIDTHMAQALNYSPKFTQAQFEIMVDAVRSGARHRCSPAQFQAAVWCGRFISLNRTPRYLPLLETLWL